MKDSQDAGGNTMYLSDIHFFNTNESFANFGVTD